MMALAKKYMGSFPAEPLPRPVYTTEPPQHGKRTAMIRREGTAERILLGYHIPSLTDKDTYPLMLLDQIMSGGRSGRLYQALVETGLATEAYSNAGSRKDPSLFYLGATAREGKSADTLEKALLEQVDRAKATKPTEKEIQAAKNQLEAYYVFQNDSVSDQGEQLGYYNTVASWHYLETLIPNLKAVTAAQVQEVAKKYLNEDNLTVAKYIPTGPPDGGQSSPSMGGGALHRSLLPSEATGVSYYRKLQRSSSCRPKLPPKQAVRSSSLNRVVLPNGIVVIVVENHSNPTIAIAGNLKAGSCFDPKSKTGTAKLVADMIQRGTTKRSALDLASAAEFVGGSLQASANTESAGFAAKSLSKDLPLMLDLLSDELRHASFPADQFDRAKGQMVSELEQSKEQPSAMAQRAFYNLSSRRSPVSRIERRGCSKGTAIDHPRRPGVVLQCVLSTGHDGNRDCGRREGERCGRRGIEVLRRLASLRAYARCRHPNRARSDRAEKDRHSDDG